MRIPITATLAPIALLAVVGCSSALVGSKAWFDSHEAAAFTKRAAFDLSCDGSKLDVTPLGKALDGYQTVGVSGCEKKATYEFIKNKWIMNNASGVEAH